MRIWLTILLVAIACQFSEDRYAKRPISSEELAGEWVATDFAMKSLKDVGVRDHLRREDHVIVLNSDGSCTLRTTLRPAGPNPQYVVYNSGCKWQLGKVGHQALLFELSPAPWQGSPYFFFDEEGGKLLLWQYATDPDAWRYLEFAKRAPSN